MRILLVGEYNRSHKFLKDGLLKLNHEARVVGLRDGFKKVDVDLDIKHYFESNIVLKKIRALVYKLLGLDLHSYFVKKQIIEHKNDLSGYDIVQFININCFLCRPKTEKKIFDLLSIWNKKAFLLSCSCDYFSVKYAYDKKFRYSILTPYFDKKIGGLDYESVLKYLSPEFIDLHNHVYKNIEGVISCDLDYTIPLQGNDKHLGLIPHPINVDEISYSKPTIKGKLTIFHGINQNNYFKKGNDIFEVAIDIIKEKYADRVDVITCRNLPYKTYINAFDKAHILLDQIFSYDQGYNALEAMAKGKVVLTGAEKEWLDHYNIKEDTIAINALPDPKEIAKKLEWLILNPEKINKISINARAFVEKEHHYINCAKLYLKKWGS